MEMIFGAFCGYVSGYIARVTNLLAAAPADNENRLPTWLFGKDIRGDDFILDNLASGL